MRFSKTPNIPTFGFDCQIAKMPDPLDMSLDEIIRNKKKSAGVSSNVRGIGSGPGPARRFGNRELLRTTPYSVALALRVLEAGNDYRWSVYNGDCVGDMGAAKGRVLVSNSKVGLEGGRGGDRSEKISARDLDADLEKYRIEAMQIN